MILVLFYNGFACTPILEQATYDKYTFRIDVNVLETAWNHQNTNLRRRTSLVSYDIKLDIDSHENQFTMAHYFTSRYIDYEMPSTSMAAIGRARL